MCESLTSSLKLLSRWRLLLGSFGQSAFENLRLNTEILSRVRENRREMTVIYPIFLKLGKEV
ncbi:MAG: hypothetical protein GY820_42265 [Gammaproteobacteria bacterium]|nr:hypothetical protein [Gammaproteobacteria bacterium]